MGCIQTCLMCLHRKWNEHTHTKYALDSSERMTIVRKMSTISMTLELKPKPKPNHTVFVHTWAFFVIEFNKRAISFKSFHFDCLRMLTFNTWVIHFHQIRKKKQRVSGKKGTKINQKMSIKSTKMTAIKLNKKPTQMISYRHNPSAASFIHLFCPSWLAHRSIYIEFQRQSANH